MKHNNQVEVTGERLAAVKSFLGNIFSEPRNYNVVELGALTVTDADTGLLVAKIDCDLRQVEIETGISVIGRTTVEFDRLPLIVQNSIQNIESTYN